MDVTINKCGGVIVKTVELQLDEQTFESARRLAKARHYTLEALIAEIIGQLADIETEADPLLGMFAHEPELIDGVVESIMESRETYSLRIVDG